MLSRIKHVWPVIALGVSFLALVSCALPSIVTSRSETIHSISPTSKPTAQWAIEQCDAIGDVAISLVDFVEEAYNEDGDINCDYTNEILNLGDQPIWVLYYKQFYYGDDPVPNDYEYGWNKAGPLQPDESHPLSSSFTYCAECTPIQYESFTFSLAVVHDVPECRWITESESLHLDILKITEEDIIFPPCTMIYPLSYSESVPDISEGLSH